MINNLVKTCDQQAGNAGGECRRWLGESMMEIPRATYRIQFGPEFGFREAREIVPYLARLGVSHLYASPIFKARRGSRHGYDIVDPNQLDPRLGTTQDFDALIEELHRNGMFYIQDIVPNHLAYDSDNWMLMDVLETETTPIFLSFFDIQWAGEDGRGGGRLLAPFLASPYHECLANGEIRITLDETGLGVTYSDTRLPLRISSYPHVLGRGLTLSSPGDPGQAGEGSLGPLAELIRTFEAMAASTSVSDHYEVIPRLKQELWKLYRTPGEIRDHIDNTLDTLNRSGALPGRNLLDDLLSRQRYKLAFRHGTEEEINYRRFFTVKTLISVNMQYPQVFEYLHRLVLDLVNAGKISGLRIDHIDGLYDPAAYLESLSKRAVDAYIIVEKVLSPGEDLPTRWKTHGTTGYDFLNRLNGLFCDPSGNAALSRIFRDFTAVSDSYEDIVYESKRLILESYMGSELCQLERLARTALESIEGRCGHPDAPCGHPGGRSDFPEAKIKETLVEIIASFPAYRTYGDLDGLSDDDLAVWRSALDEALRRRGDLAAEIEAFERAVMAAAQALILRLQQYTGPAMAKGSEDTALYLYNRLVSLNEVGGDPGKFGVSIGEFHGFIERRLESWPASMSTTSTHDTKRGEDARARINVLSEIPAEWEARVTAWRTMNRKHTGKNNGCTTPDANLEYLIYQSLVGAWPFEAPDSAGSASAAGDLEIFVHRMRVFAVKAAREAKTRTSWDHPDKSTEDAIVNFIEAILDESRAGDFLSDFRSFEEEVSHYGILNSLSQTLIKLAAPGVPDIYQGSELWNLSLVDPDNRRPVDFPTLEKHLGDILEAYRHDPLRAVGDLLSSPADGRLKLFVTYASLKARKENIAVFSEGSYIPIESSGEFGRHVVAFARIHGDRTALAVAPRLLTGMVEPDEMPLGDEVWKDTEIVLPDALSSGPAASRSVGWAWRNVITGEVIAAEGTLRLAEVLRHFPVALLLSSRKGIDEKR